MKGWAVAVAVTALIMVTVLTRALWVATDRTNRCAEKLGYGATNAQGDFCYPPPVRVDDMPAWLPWGGSDG